MLLEFDEAALQLVRALMVCEAAGCFDLLALALSPLLLCFVTRCLLDVRGSLRLFELPLAGCSLFLEVGSGTCELVCER